MAEWLPIESAPKDGVKVTVGKMNAYGHVPWPIDARFLDGIWKFNLGADQWSQFEPQPTHWTRPVTGVVVPLPAPPAIKEET